VLLIRIATLLLLELVLLKTTLVGEPRRVDDKNLEKRSRTLTTFTNASTYVTTPFFLISSYGCQVSLALVVGTTLVIGMVENAKVVVISVVADKDVSD